MKKIIKFIIYFSLVIVLLAAVACTVHFFNKKAKSDQALAQDQRNAKRQELIIQKDTLEKNIKSKSDEGESYDKLSKQYCGSLNPPEGYIIRQTDYQTYLQQCEEYKRKAIETYNQAKSMITELEGLNIKISNGIY